MRRALLLHDDEPLLALMESVLVAEGFEVDVARDAYRAMELPRGVSQLVVVALAALDERDLDLVGLLRERNPAAYMILTFPVSLRDRAAKALSLGADAYLPEPFYPGELAAVARRVGVREGAEPEEEADATQDPRTVLHNGSGSAPAPPEEGVEQLAAGVAHLTRQPLQILELMLGGAESGDPVQVEAAREQVQRISGVVDTLQRFSNVGRAQPHRQEIDLNAAVEKAFAGDDARTTRRFTFELSPDRPLVLAQPEPLAAALSILRNRADRVTPAGGTISVRTRSRQDPQGPRAELVVEDCGPALDRERLGRLFVPFPDREALRDNTWLDLPSVAGIIRSFGGSVTATPGSRAGTAIRVVLPVKADRPSRAGA